MGLKLRRQGLKLRLEPSVGPRGKHFHPQWALSSRWATWQTLSPAVGTTVALISNFAISLAVLYKNFM